VKKKGIIIIVGIFILILVLRYIEQKSTESIPVSKISQQKKGSIGVPLPKGATEEMSLAKDVDVDIDIGDISGNISVLAADGNYKLACEQGSIENIMAERGSMWGVDKPSRRTFTDKESFQIYTLLTDYMLCRSLVSGENIYCKSLPKIQGNAEKADVLIEDCERFCKVIDFAGYVAGRRKDEKICRRFMTLWPEGAPHVPEDVFCEEAARGLEGICSAGVEHKYLSPSMKKECLSNLPAKLSDCNNRDTCVALYNFYHAFKKQNCLRFSGSKRDICRAYLKKSQDICFQIAARISKDYCRFLTNVDKAENDITRMSEEERKEYLAEQKRKKMEEEKFKKEQQELMEKINKDVRKFLKESEYEEEK